MAKEYKDLIVGLDIGTAKVMVVVGEVMPGGELRLAGLGVAPSHGLKRSAQVNGLSGLCITKLDVLDGLDELKLCTGYKLDGELIDLLPMGADDIACCQPIYETMPGCARMNASTFSCGASW